jgi:hypothetical protein
MKEIIIAVNIAIVVTYFSFFIVAASNHEVWKQL